VPRTEHDMTMGVKPGINFFLVGISFLQNIEDFIGNR
jgi:hypothetical protein